ncbi:helix-turn-helix domain-containing protein [Virgibacillus sp. YIM 98842]|uniref:PucR family transcriptional regulator n=1 Tax=Virgibacillus sp. YIM 98842 TaxID=2663533 RepID=UPI0013DC8E8F|nr:helix-turn-helix domain-containing protein [Virgibacillus sp. YIM 98842]
MKYTSNEPGYHLKRTFNSFEQLADYIGDIFDCPITIEDNNHQVIAYSKHRENVDEARISTIMNRKVPDKIINSLWKNEVMPRLIDSDEPVSISEIKEIGLGNRVAISIWKKKEVLGFIWIHISDKTLSESELSLLKEAAWQVKKLLLAKNSGITKSEESYKDFFWQLLTGNMRNPEEIQNQAKQFNVNLKDKLTVVVFRFSDQITEQIEKHAYYLAEIQTQTKVIFRLFDENEFILLVRIIKDSNIEDRLQDFMKQFIYKISSQLELNGINGASGFIYDEAAHIKNAYKEAIRTIHLKSIFPKELKHTFLYEDLGVYKFIDELYTTWNKQNQQNKYVRRLREYDEKNKTALLKTLQYYLQSDSNVYRSAKQLFIHPNTMNYRLKRIKEVSGLDLKDTVQKTAVYLELIMENI